MKSEKPGVFPHGWAKREAHLTLTGGSAAENAKFFTWDLVYQPHWRGQRRDVFAKVFHGFFLNRKQNATQKKHKTIKTPIDFAISESRFFLLCGQLCFQYFVYSQL